MESDAGRVATFIQRRISCLNFTPLHAHALRKNRQSFECKILEAVVEEGSFLAYYLKLYFGIFLEILI